MISINQNTKGITPCLWFQKNAEEAVQFYHAVFENSEIQQTAYYGDSGANMGMQKDDVLTITFTLNGTTFMALNGGTEFPFSPAISLMVNCDTQEQIDHYWEKLSAGGKTSQCGWLDDKFGISWQIVPAELGTWMKDPIAANRVMQALMPMNKLDIATLKNAYENK